VNQWSFDNSSFAWSIDQISHNLQRSELRKWVKLHFLFLISYLQFAVIIARSELKYHFKVYPEWFHLFNSATIESLDGDVIKQKNCHNFNFVNLEMSDLVHLAFKCVDAIGSIHHPFQFKCFLTPLKKLKLNWSLTSKFIHILWLSSWEIFHCLNFRQFIEIRWLHFPLA
jgi:hypothetical protein